MKKWLPILIFSVGVGNAVSFGQKAHFIDPFQSYVAQTRLKTPDRALILFGAQCGVELNAALPVYAARPDNAWIAAKDLKSAFRGLETDFFATPEIRKQKDLTLIEQWWVELDTEAESRDLYCFKDSNLSYAQTVYWSLPKDEDGKSFSPLWGCEQNWKPTANGFLKLTNQRFIDGNGRQILTPQLNGLPADKANWPSPTVHKLEDLELPQKMLW